MWIGAGFNTDLMVQFEVISGKQAGLFVQARRFPFHIGRSAQSDLRLDDPGVWDDHATLLLDDNHDFIVKTGSHAVISVNSDHGESFVVRNGDSIEIGGARLRFWMAEARQSRLRSFEVMVGLTIVAVTLTQLAVINWLLRQ